MRSLLGPNVWFWHRHVRIYIIQLGFPPARWYFTVRVVRWTPRSSTRWSKPLGSGLGQGWAVGHLILATWCYLSSRARGGAAALGTRAEVWQAAGLGWAGTRGALEQLSFCSTWRFWAKESGFQCECGSWEEEQNLRWSLFKFWWKLKALLAGIEQAGGGVSVGGCPAGRVSISRKYLTKFSMCNEGKEELVGLKMSFCQWGKRESSSGQGS